MMFLEGFSWFIPLRQSIPSKGKGKGHPKKWHERAGELRYSSTSSLSSALEGVDDQRRGEFRPRQTRQLPRAVDLKGRLLSCQSY